MTIPSQFCEQCGTALPTDAVFCEQCGAHIAKPTQMQQAVTQQPPMEIPVPVSPVQPSPAQVQPQDVPQPSAPAQQPLARRFPGWLILGLGLAGIICIGSVIAGVYFIPKMLDSADSGPQSVAVQPTAVSVSPTATPDEPQPVAPPVESDGPITVDGGVFFDFSSGAQGWPIENTDEWGSLGVQDGMYELQVGDGISPLTYPPVDFPIRRMKFDIVIPQEYPEQNGVLIQCYFDDSIGWDIDIDVHNGKFKIHEFADFSTPWLDLTEWNNPGETNQIEVVCDEYSIGLTVNGWGEAGGFHVEEQPVNRIKLLAWAWSNDPSGFTVLLDNIYVYESP